MKFIVHIIDDSQFMVNLISLKTFYYGTQDI